MPIQSTWLGRLSAAWLALAACAAGAEPLTLDRLLKIEGLGASALSPDGRHLVVETARPYDEAKHFDFRIAAAELGRLTVADLSTGAASHPLLRQESGSGYLAGPFSPSGERMIVYRWKARRWDAGIVEVATGQVRWLGFGVELALYGRSLQWLSDRAFVAIALEPGDAPLHLKGAWQNQARTQALWKDQATGRTPTLTVMGSGPARGGAPRRDRQLVRIDVQTGAKTVLAEGGFFDLEVSPSGRFVAALGEAEPIGLAPTAAVRLSAPSRRRALSIIDLATGAAFEPCGSCTTLIQPMTWAPGADRLLVYQHDARSPEITGGVFVVDAATRQRAQVGEALRPDLDYGSEGFATVRADWLGSRPIILGKASQGARSDWFAVAGQETTNLTAKLSATAGDIAILDGDTLLALSAGSAWRITGDGQATQTARTGVAWFRSTAFGAGSRLAAAPLRSASPVLRTAAGVEVEPGRARNLDADKVALAVTKAGVVFEERQPSGIARVGLWMAEGGTRDLVVVNGTMTSEDLGQVRSIEAPGPDGRMLKSWLVLPTSWRPGERPPLVVIPYPGSAPQRFPARLGTSNLIFTPNAALLAAQGYAVLTPALPRDRSKGEPAEGLADQILAVVDKAVAEGYADPGRLALWGHSFGGYAGLATATQTHRFRAIVAEAGPSNYTARWGAILSYFWTAPEEGAPSATLMGYSETGQGALNGPPWRETARYVRNSPIFQADKVTTPMMLIYGDQDQVPLSEGQAMFNALYRQDKDATLISLFGEGHVPTSPANIRAIYGIVLPWLADRLGAAPAAADAKRPSQ